MAAEDDGSNGSESTDRELRTDRDSPTVPTNVRRFGFEFDPFVFPASLAIVAAFVLVTVGLGDQAAQAYTLTNAFVNEYFGWLYVLAVNAFLIALIAIAWSDFGDLRLGGPNATTEFSSAAWFAMLFSSGMGIGLLFFGVAEPINHLLSGGGSFFDAAPNTPAAGGAATALTMFHWGFHPWAIYGIVGLGLAFFAYNRNLPLSFRSIFYPVFGERIWGWPGRLIDLAAVVATVFGLATTTGLSALQINAGINFLTANYLGAGIPTTVWTATAIIAVLIGATVASTWLGLERGIKRLSKVNIVLMATLLVLMFAIGPTVHLFDVFLSGLGTYLGNFLELSLSAEAFAGEDAGWQHSYTIFYWGFWIVWSPFVGLFIARISKGRTIREFVVGVLLVPVLWSLLWMAAFNGAAIFAELTLVPGGISGPLQEQGRAVALFEMFSAYPLTLVTVPIATLNLITFFVTSADSGALVTGYLTAGGVRETSTGQRILWPIVIGVSAVALLFGNGLQALKTAVIAAGLPFSVVILFMVYTVYLGLSREVQYQETRFEWVDTGTESDEPPKSSDGRSDDE